MNIFENSIPYETITCNDKDPLWMNKQIKTLIAEKKRFIWTSETKNSKL